MDKQSVREQIDKLDARMDRIVEEVARLCDGTGIIPNSISSMVLSQFAEKGIIPPVEIIELCQEHYYLLGKWYTYNELLGMIE